MILLSELYVSLKELCTVIIRFGTIQTTRLLQLHEMCAAPCRLCDEAVLLRLESCLGQRAK